MSSDQLHGHWILYAILFNYMQGSYHSNLYTFEGRKKASLYIPWEPFIFLFQTLRTDEINNPLPKFEFSGTDRHHSVTVNTEFVEGPIKLDPRRLDVVFWGLLAGDLVDHIYWGPHGWALADRMRKDYPESQFRLDLERIRPEEMHLKIEPDGAFSGPHAGGVVFEPSILGMDLFLRAQGLPPDEMMSFASLRYDFLPEEFKNKLMTNVRLVEQPPVEA